LNNQNQGQDFLSDHNKFEFQDVLLYHDGLVYVPNGLARLQVLQARHDAPTINHFGCNKTMELVFWYYWHNFGNMLRSFLGRVMSMHEQRILVITHMDSFNHCQSLHQHDFQSSWTLSQIFHFLNHTFYFGNGGLLDKDGSFYSLQQNNNWWKDNQVLIKIMFISIITFLKISFFIGDPNLHPSFGKGFFNY